MKWTTLWCWNIFLSPPSCIDAGTFRIDAQERNVQQTHHAGSQQVGTSVNSTACLCSPNNDKNTPFKRLERIFILFSFCRAIVNHFWLLLFCLFWTSAAEIPPLCKGLIIKELQNHKWPQKCFEQSRVFVEARVGAEAISNTTLTLQRRNHHQIWIVAHHRICRCRAGLSCAGFFLKQFLSNIRHAKD